MFTYSILKLSIGCIRLYILIRQRNKDRDNASNFATLGDDMAAKKALAGSVEVNYELVRKLVKVCHNLSKFRH